MRAAVLEQIDTDLRLRELPDPIARGSEVVVEVRGAGVCHTDLGLVAGTGSATRLPLVPGHEVAAHDEQLGDVLVYFAWGCGRCEWCRSGEEQLCPRADYAGFTRDGGYAELMLVPDRRYLLPLNGLDPVQAAPLADAGLVAFRVVRRITGWLRPGDPVVVRGAGGFGQFAVQYLKLWTSARVVAVDVSEHKRARALQLGADEALAPEDLADPARVVLDFVMTEETLAKDAEIVAPGGVVVAVGEGRTSVSISSWPYESYLTNALLGSLDDLRAVLELARGGELDWHVEAVPLEHANEALARLRRGEVRGRLVLAPDAGRA